MAESASFKCFKCGHELEFSTGVGRRDDCDKCGADVHVCLNCRFYDSASYNECREPSAEVVLEKDRANFCDYFEAGGVRQAAEDLDKLKAAAEALFKKN